MPRKQRFKPSRKPKPIPQTEEAMIGQPVGNAAPDRGVARATPQEQDDDPDDGSPTESESDQRAR